MLKLPGLKTNVILAPYTTYKIGGPADMFFVAKNKADLAKAVQEARGNKVPYFVLGTGANILVADKGFRGLVIKNEVNHIEFQDNKVLAGSGVTMKDLIVLTKERGLSGLEHYAGIPSSVGGALWQNLHFLSPDRTNTVFIESVLESAEILDEDGKLRVVEKDFFEFGYDDSILHHKNILVTEALFSLVTKDKNSIELQIMENMRWREEKHPALDEFPSCGSVFKKIDGVGAGRLIERVGLKGYKVGGAQVSEKHANFLVNTGAATARDVLSLIKVIQEKVKLEEGYDLETEIGFVGEF